MSGSTGKINDLSQSKFSPKNNRKTYLKRTYPSPCVILATWKAEIKRIAV
jgi:hypothetical protein